MEFRTKLDFSSNRQVKQYQKTTTILSGGTSFGLPFSALTVGPNLSTTLVTNAYTNITSSFSGNSATTLYTWYVAGMATGESALSPLTPLNSTTTQNTGDVFVSIGTASNVDGDVYSIGYSGVSFDILPSSFVNLGGGNYSGTVFTNLLSILSADALDFSGRTIWVDVSGITRTDKLIVNTTGATFSNIGSQSSAGSLHYTLDGTLTTNTSDRRLKTNIEPITNALAKVLELNGVYYNWSDSPNGDKRIGFIAQDVKSIVPELVFVNNKTNEKYMGVHYDNVTSLLVEAVKELATGSNVTIKPKVEISNVSLNTQTVIAEDNNIELNYNGTHQTSIGGGIMVLHAIGDSINAKLITDDNGDWTTNNNFKPQGLITPLYTPKSSFDESGVIGSTTYDDDFIYIKTNNGWKRTKLESF